MHGLIDFPDAEAALDRRLSFNIAPPVALAFSGGGDSMALLHLARTWAARRGRRLLALTVDHRLHPDSAAWTAFAARAADAAGVDWRALEWRGEKPPLGLPAAARAARHRLLADAAREAGAQVILFAHTADDAAEGDLMRAGPAPTLGHLRTWSPSPAWPEGRGVFALRPLLGVRRAALRTWLETRSLPWLDDPANEDVRYARVQARAAIASEGVIALRRAERAPPIELVRAMRAHPDGRLTLPRSALAEADAGDLRRIFSAALICASGRTAPPRRAALDRLMSRLAEPAFVATLAGGRISANIGGLTFAREAGDMRRAGVESLTLAAGETGAWDGRFEIAAEAVVTIGALGGAMARLSKLDRAQIAALPPAVRPTLPAILRGEAAALCRPFGQGPAHARALAGDRFAAAGGLIGHERDISHGAMAQARRSSYVEALALA